MTTRNFDKLFRPKSIALIGASAKPGTVGAVLCENLLSGGFKGEVWLVNPNRAAIMGRETFASVAGLPGVPDLAIVAVKASRVPETIGALCERGCRAAVVVSSGFGAFDDTSAVFQDVLEIARPCLMRILGPNSLGFIAPHLGINASFAATAPKAGDIALVSQSGTIINTMLDWAQERSVGFSQVVSLGDMADVDFGDMLDFLSGDRRTRAIFLYAENITQAKKFMSAARIASRTRPVIVIKSGRTAAGSRAALSHTGALAGSDIVYGAAFDRAGLLRVNKIEEVFETAETLAAGVRIKGDGLTIVTNGGAAGVLATDALEAYGGHLTALDDTVLDALDRLLPPQWSRSNPIDLLGDADGSRYAAALEALAGQNGQGAILVIHSPNAVTSGPEIAGSVSAFKNAHKTVPVLANWLGARNARSARGAFEENGIAAFESPSKAVRAFTHLVRYQANQRDLMETPEAGIYISGFAIRAARDLIDTVLAEGRAVMSEPESKQLLRLFDIPVIETRFARDAEEAARHAAAFGGAVALKIVSPDIAHKSDLGGVRLGLRGPDEVAEAARRMAADIAALSRDLSLTGFTVQPMADLTDAQELIAGIATDETFGPVILFGRGGRAVEVIGDRAVGLPPLNSALARRIIDRTQVSKVLAGYGSVPAAPSGIITDILVRLSEMVVHLPQIVELDINPLLVRSDSVLALDGHVAVRPMTGGADRLSIRPYPHALERASELKDGERYVLRPIRPDDETALAEMVSLTDPDDLRLRFMGPMKQFPHEMAARFTQIDYDREMALVATRSGAAYGRAEVFGVVRLIADPENEKAEYAVLVRSDMKGKGLGYALMNAILDYAKQRGLKQVYGEILRENTNMIRMARNLGFETGKFELGSDVAHVVFDVDKAAGRRNDDE
ncbi:bifunctional acetate--CoA ligase family protein/GNAT family N-acetyltransferase [Fulvimarina sp. 2208YS6-2-32]|uniref:Bifunctional acetate--CoA ligase family protein/GNAT family N-acetyltransferase n=1 Tax=Fulvimarina uroteuthidis TaxID=3098149 RepID=A0ABU5I5T8_9HYPH|nr:bifunctional acetate--CoA ligase family protein/GNAT family N-acetyltransferase [Fulvimarina sp. 2208YS6-2-32]MDY8110744.1 bifunctional acetate--CoA ligase family protein/GNAT family N-acetyltransferase [Fulvimarina sp. 2208YS6-2-32]